MEEDMTMEVFNEFTGISKAKDRYDPVPTKDDAILEEMAAFAEEKDPEFAARFRAMFCDESHLAKRLLSRAPEKTQTLWYMVIDEDDAKALSPRQPIEWSRTFGYIQKTFPEYEKGVEEEILELLSSVLTDISGEYIGGICDEEDEE